MPRAWYMDDSSEDPQAEHHLDPPHYLTLEQVKALSGVEYYEVDVDHIDLAIDYWDLRDTRGYIYEDVCEISPKKMPDFDQKLKTFFTEHLHADEEIRLILDGEGYFDVRDVDDKWIRIFVEKGDLLILPAGIYHRFTTTHLNYAKAERLFCGEPVWKALNRPHDFHPARLNYMNKMNSA